MFNNWWLKHNLQEDLRMQVDTLWESWTGKASLYALASFSPPFFQSPFLLGQHQKWVTGLSEEGCHSYRIPLSELHWKFVISKKIFLVFGGFMPSSSCNSRPIKDFPGRVFPKSRLQVMFQHLQLVFVELLWKKQGSRLGVWPGYWAEVEANKDKAVQSAYFN